ncbi:hypothetical protein CA598_06005 [Paenibacillus sp. VTT E-133291]|nr:hypothetical protein CA598_06005 [Paenibacillus sp. VTT E-133291]
MHKKFKDMVFQAYMRGWTIALLIFTVIFLVNGNYSGLIWIAIMAVMFMLFVPVMYIVILKWFHPPNNDNRK